MVLDRDLWVDAILQALPKAGASVGADTLEVLVAQAVGKPLHRQTYGAAIDWLAAQQMVGIAGKTLWRREPDFEERELVPSVELYLRGPDLQEQLKLRENTYIVENTTVGGRVGTGTWSRPDFTVAAIRRFRFHPSPHLDVFSFELKNRRGKGVVAVHEALAHARFAHYPYLVCPRSELNTEEDEFLRMECAALGVGYITFLLHVKDDARPNVTNFAWANRAQRMSPDPEKVDQHLRDRLSSIAQESLAAIIDGG